jgi:hypothetical protein
MAPKLREPMDGGILLSAGEASTRRLSYSPTLCTCDGDVKGKRLFLGQCQVQQHNCQTLDLLYQQMGLLAVLHTKTRAPLLPASISGNAVDPLLQIVSRRLLVTTTIGRLITLLLFTSLDGNRCPKMYSGCSTLTDMPPAQVSAWTFAE